MININDLGRVSLCVGDRDPPRRDTRVRLHSAPNIHPPSLIRLIYTLAIKAESKGQACGTCLDTTRSLQHVYKRYRVRAVDACVRTRAMLDASRTRHLTMACTVPLTSRCPQATCSLRELLDQRRAIMAALGRPERRPRRPPHAQQHTSTEGKRAAHTGPRPGAARIRPWQRWTLSSDRGRRTASQRPSRSSPSQLRARARVHRR